MSEQTFDVAAVSVAEQQSYGGVPFPLVLACQTPNTTLEAASAWIDCQRAEIEKQLANVGAILFRGFPLASAQDFDAFIGAFAYPSKLLFFCEHAAEIGGATPICRSDVLYEQRAERLPDFLRACEEKGLRDTNVMPSLDDPASGMGRSWQGTFRRETREEVEARMRELNYSWEWLDDGCLRATTPRLQAVREVSPGRKTFFNQLIAAFTGWKDTRNDPSKAITLGDGTPLERNAVILAADMAEALTFNIPWQAGDVALVDNYVVMHGRRTFTGKRKILASLVAA